MNIVFLPSTRADLQWFKRYYISRFPEGRRNADAQFLNSIALLKANPFIGHPSETHQGLRIHSIPRTPFSVVYRVATDRIEILRVLDHRSEESNDLP